MFQRRAEALGLEEVRIAPRSPWQLPYSEEDAHLSFTRTHLNPMPFEPARPMEMDLAEDLRRDEYTITGGH